MRRDSAGALQRFAALDQQSFFRTSAGRNHHRRRHGQPHGAGAGDDQDRDRGRHGADATPFTASDRPHQTCDQGDRHDDRDEHGTDTVHQILDRRSRPLCGAHQLDDSRQRAAMAEQRAAHVNGPRRVQRAADDTIARRLANRERLAGQHRLVNAGGSPDDFPIDRQPLAGTHRDDLARVEVGDGNVALAVRGDQVRHGRLQRDEGAQRRRGLPPRTRLERAAREDQRQNRDHSLEIHVRRQPVAREDRRSHGRDR